MKKIIQFTFIVIMMVIVGLALNTVSVSDVAAYPPPETNTPASTSTPIQTPIIPTFMPPDYPGNYYGFYYETILGRLFGVCESCNNDINRGNYIMKVTWFSSLNGWNEHYGTYTGITINAAVYEIPITPAYTTRGCFNFQPIAATIYNGSTPLYNLTYEGSNNIYLCFVSLPLMIFQSGE